MLARRGGPLPRRAIMAHRVICLAPHAPDPTTMPVKPAPFGGYCRLRHLEDAGWPRAGHRPRHHLHADMLPSLVDTFLAALPGVQGAVSSRRSEMAEGNLAQAPG
jgi:hypothetical protein